MIPPELRLNRLNRLREGCVQYAGRYRGDAQAAIAENAKALMRRARWTRRTRRAGIGSSGGRSPGGKRLEAFGEDGRPYRFDHEDRYGGAFRADHGLGRKIGLGRDLAELAFRMGLGLGILVLVGDTLVAEDSEQVYEKSPQQKPAGLPREMTEDSHTWEGI